LKAILGNTKGKGLDKVGVEQDGSYIKVIQKESIENACYEKNKQKFIQINNTLAIRGKLQEELGFIGDSKAYKQILNRTYLIPTDIDDYAKEFLLALKKPSELVDTLKAAISTDQFQKV